MFVIIAFPLGVQSLLAYARNTSVANVTEVTKAWLAGSEYTLVSVDLDQTQAGVDVVIKGSGELPPQSDLSEALTGQAFGLDVILEVIPAERTRLNTQ